VQRLVATKNPRAAEPLKRALRGTHGFGGLFSNNQCVRKDLQTGIKALEGEAQ